ncbi:sugar phosphate isomerase/epimerase family protein [Oceanobacillus polygoni]|uniref:Sugar phosphate isomerase/epimerase n=1 Tax=Oceanobacillus polygoni TaxID=1235259 RepID=A0A9X0Z1Q1_9BACI|nr:sugar phosphate isomerase/epimerase family protein [Oceanobacillus polygoni]MBP2079621.1 sugar phosphate isomerase/epimerase [Oceanobacillus polygoni]
MKLFIASSLCWDYHPNEVITIAKENGLHGVELWAEHIYYHQANPAEIRIHAEKESIELTLHASSWDLNICSINKGIQEQSIAELKKSIDLASALGALHMTFHPGRLTVKKYLVDEHMRALVTNTKRLLEYAAVREVVLSVEMMEPIAKEILTEPKAMNYFLEQVGGGLQVTFDIAHTPLEESNQIYLKELQRVNSIHVSDSKRDQYHVPLGEGEINLEEILPCLAEKDLPIVLEGMDTGRSLFFLKKHLNYLHKEWKERKRSI